MLPITYVFCDKNQTPKAEKLTHDSVMCFVNSISVPCGPTSGAEFSYLGNGAKDLNSDLLGYSQAYIK